MRDILEDLASARSRDPVALAREKMKADLPRRFYREVGVEERDGAFCVVLDGRPVKTPSRNPLAVPTRRQAGALAGEWEAQQTEINPATMPVTRLANSIIDGVTREMEAVKDEIARYAPGDLLLFRAEGPDSLVARHSKSWDPVLKWASLRLGVTFVPVTGIMPHPQDPRIAPSLRGLLPDDPFRIGALHTLTTIFGSALLAFAVQEGEMDAVAAFNAACLDEDWNTEKWGHDEEAAARRNWRETEVKAAALFLE